MDDVKSLVGFMVGFVFGSLMGVVVGLLLAPQSGEETRDQLRLKGIELKTRAEELSDEGRVRFEEAVQEGKSAASKKKEELTKRLEDEKESSKPKAKKAKA
jgi:gas vesicle protein